MDQTLPVGGWASIYFGVHHRLQCLDHVKNLKSHLSETWILQRGWHCMMLPLAGERIDSQSIAPWSLNCSCWHKAACWVPLIILKVGTKGRTTDLQSSGQILRISISLPISSGSAWGRLPNGSFIGTGKWGINPTCHSKWLGNLGTPFHPMVFPNRPYRKRNFASTYLFTYPLVI